MKCHKLSREKKLNQKIIGKCSQSTAVARWQNFVNQNVVNALLKQGNFLWVAAEGGVVKWNLKDNTFISYTVLDGLADNFVFSIGMDKNQNMWFGTYGAGISKFDGKQWTNYAEKEGLLAKYIMTIFTDSNGAIWCGSNNGIFKFDGNKWFCPKEYLFLRKKTVTAIYIDNTKAIWFGLKAYGVVRVYKGKNQFWNDTNGLLDNMVNYIEADNKGKIWIGTNKGINVFNNETACLGVLDIQNNGPESSMITSIIQDKEENIWCGTSGGYQRDKNNNMWLGGMGGGAFVFSGKEWKRYTSEQGLIQNTVRAIIVDENNDKWFGTDDGISKFDGKNWTEYKTSHECIATNRILSIITDKEGEVWLGTARRGVCKFSQNKWISYGDKANTAINNAQVVVIDNKDESLWVGTAFGAYNFEGENWKKYKETDGLAHNYISDIAIDEQGNKWFGTRGGGVSKFDGSNWVTYNSKTVSSKIFKRDIIRAITIKGNEVWIGTYGGGAIFFDGKNWTNYTSSDGLAGDDVYEIFINQDKSIWFGTNRGISILKGNKWTNIVSSKNSLWCILKSLLKQKQWKVLVQYIFQTSWKVEKELSGDHVWDMAVDKQNNIWFATIGGVTKYDGKCWKKYTMADGVCDHNVRAITVDKDDNVWIGTIGGLSKFIKGGE